MNECNLISHYNTTLPALNTRPRSHAITPSHDPLAHRSRPIPSHLPTPIHPHLHLPPHPQTPHTTTSAPPPHARASAPPTHHLQVHWPLGHAHDVPHEHEHPGPTQSPTRISRDRGPAMAGSEERGGGGKGSLTHFDGFLLGGDWLDGDLFGWLSGCMYVCM